MGASAVALTILLAAGAASAAESTDDKALPGEKWTSNLKAPLVPKPADDVGGSWAATLLGGRMTDASLVQTFLFNFGWAEATLVSGEIAYTLKADNPFQRFMDPVLNNIDVVLNVTYQDDPTGTIWQLNPYVMARWNKFPWSNTIRTTFGLGGGLSYATGIASIEYEPTKPDGDYDNLLHYIAIEATFALPKYKDWQLVYRLHHRSGVFGLMQSDNSGNTAVEIGLRHYFDW